MPGLYDDTPKETAMILLRTSPPSLGRDTLGLGTPGTLWGWALQGDSGVGHSSKVGHFRNTLGLGTPRVWHSTKNGAGHWSWALQGDWARRGHSGVGHSRDSGVGDSRQNLGLGALQGHFGVGHSRDERGVDRARRRVPGEEKR